MKLSSNFNGQFVSKPRAAVGNALSPRDVNVVLGTIEAADFSDLIL